MIQLSDEIFEKLLKRLSLKKDEVTYLAGGREDNDGILYSFVREGKKKVIKIAAKDNERSAACLEEKLDFAHYLGECGISIACPEQNEDGSIFQTVRDDKYIYLASVMDFVDGKSPETKELTDRVAHEWGELTGKMHKATKNYKIWKNYACAESEWAHEDEIVEFYEMCRNEEVKASWLDIKHQLVHIPKTRENYGMIHNDNHQYNIIQKDSQITLIDFDCASCHFLHNDILLPIQGLLFDEAGGMNRPVVDLDRLHRFYEHFLDGYELHNHVENEWSKQMGILLNYRRLLLFTVMQGWMEADAEAREGFLGMIREEPAIELW